MAHPGEEWELSLSHAIVLGMLAEQPASGYQLDVQMEERFGGFRYASGTAKKAAKALRENGLVRFVEGRPGLRVSAGRAQTIYELTPAGERRFREWMRAPVSTPPVREELDAKIALCQSEDLPGLIETIRSGELACLTWRQSLNYRLQSRRAKIDRHDRRARMSMIVSSSEEAWWDWRIKWLQCVRMYLEDELRLENEAHDASRSTQMRV